MKSVGSRNPAQAGLRNTLKKFTSLTQVNPAWAGLRLRKLLL